MNYSISKIIPYVRRYVLLGIYDVLDGERVPYQKKEDTVVAKAEVYGNLSTFSISAEEQEMGTELKVTLLQSCVGLSEQGKERAMTAVMDRIVQYLENELLIHSSVVQITSDCWSLRLTIHRGRPTQAHSIVRKEGNKR